MVYKNNSGQKVKHLHQDIIEQCLQGDAKGYESLYRLYSKAMYNIALRITRHEAEAEDVLQESFVSAFKNLTSYHGEATFGAWLKRIVINRSINMLRKNRIETEDISGLLEQIEGKEQDDLIEKEVLWESKDLRIEKIRKEINNLPDGYRLVFSLYALEGYDHKEISEILGITESTSKSQYSRSKKKLKQLVLQSDEGR